MIKLVAFDIFGTLIDMEGVPRDELEAYGNHIREPEWSPLVLPESWKHLDTFLDLYRGLSTIRSKGCDIITLSNAPIAFQVELWCLNWDAGGQWINYYVPLELRKVFKPNLDAYRILFDLFPTLQPDEFCMVTANEHFGDIEAARSLGMQAVLIRGDTGKDVTSLVEMCK